MANPIEAITSQTLAIKNNESITGKNKLTKNLLQIEESALPDTGTIIATAIAAVGSLKKNPVQEISKSQLDRNPVSKKRHDSLTEFYWCHAPCQKNGCGSICGLRFNHGGSHNCGNGHSW